MAENLPLATIHQTVLEFLRNRKDVSVFGAQAVNAYTAETRMTQDVDLMSTAAESFATELCQSLNQKLHIAARVRKVAQGQGFRIYQLQQPQNRHLVDIRQVDQLPPSQSANEILVVKPAELVALKIISLSNRLNTPKGFTDQADLSRLLLTFPELQSTTGSVADALEQFSANMEANQLWQQFAVKTIQPDIDDGY